MNTFVGIFSGDGWMRLAMTLAHSLWEGLTLSVLLFVALRLIPARRANLRYLASIVALAGLFLLGGATWVVLGKSPSSAHPLRALRSEVSPTDSAEIASTAPSAPILSAGPIYREVSAPVPVSRFSANADGDSVSRRALWSQWAVAFWFVGVAIMLGRVTLLMIASERSRRKCEVVRDEGLLEAIGSLRSILQLGRRVRVAVGAHISSPAVLGVIWPTILLPASLLSGIPPELLQAILAHELAHIRRHDYLINLMQLVVEALLFFNPAVWWISRQIRIEREACCDALAAGALGEKLNYARALAAAADYFRSADSAIQSTVQPAVAFGGGRPYSLLDRVRRLLVPAYHPQPRVSLVWSLFILFLSVGIVGLVHRGAALAAEKTSAWLSGDKIEEIRRIQAEFNRDQSARRRGGERARIRVSGTIKTEDGSKLPQETKISISSYPGSKIQEIGWSDIRNGEFSAEIEEGSISIEATTSSHATAYALPPSSVRGEKDISGVELILKKGFEGKIRLVDEAGNPIKQANVDVFPALTHFPATLSDSYHSDDNGFVTIDHCTEQPFHFEILGSGFQYELKPSVRLTPGETLTWKLKPEKTIRGKVVSKATGAPLSASIHCQAQGPTESWGHLGRFDAGTDLSGEFTLNNLRNGSVYSLYVTSIGYRRGSVSSIVAGKKDVTISLDVPISVAGRITGDLDKLPVEADLPPGSAGDARMIPYSIQTFDRGGGTWSYIRLTKGKEGSQFKLGGLEPGYLTFMPNTDDAVRLSVEKSIDGLEIELGKKKVRRREIILKPELPADAPAPLGSLNVQFFPDDPSLPEDHRDFEAKEGEIRLEVAAPGRVQIWDSRLVGYTSPWISEGVQVPAGTEPFELKLPLFPAGAIYGTITEADGSDAQMVYVTPKMVEAPKGFEKKTFIARAKDSLGGYFDSPTRYAASPLPFGGTYKIFAAQGNRLVESEAIRVDADHPIQHVDFRFKTGVTLTGRVLDPSGKPVAGASVVLRYQSPHQGLGASALGETFSTDDEGRFTIEKVNPEMDGEYYFYAGRGEEFARSKSRWDTAKRDVEIKLEPPNGFHGVCVDDKTGKPVPRAWINVIPLNPAEPEFYRRDYDASFQLVADEKGEFDIANLARQSYKVVARREPTHFSAPINLVKGNSTIRGGEDSSLIFRIDAGEAEGPRS